MHPRLAVVHASCGLGLVLSVVGVRSAASGSTPVTAELVIPPAVTHVIGDATPIIWRFRNQTDEPLAFMWEGCCRLNGRLEVTSPASTPVELIPPGQALAHMFAKAERLEPGQAADYDTRVSDWVRLHESGTYRLQGRYTGVLPDQQPQVPRGLALWRSAAITPPTSLSVLSVDDYLVQRDDRTRKRGLALDLNGPPRLVPPNPLELQLDLRNLQAEPQAIEWPNALQLWVVDPEGQRVANIPTFLDGPYEVLTVPARGSIRRVLQLDPVRFEGVPFGAYRLFIDLDGPAAAGVRVPSNPLPIEWRLESSTVEVLLHQAARGPRIGLRNASLKLLRVYLGELGPQLEQIAAATTDPPSRDLARQLALASQLKPLAPKPGRVDWPIKVGPQGTLELTHPHLEAVAQHFPVGERLPALLALRRHLGWEVGLTLHPTAQTTVTELFGVAAHLASVQAELAGPPRAGTVGELTNAMGGFTLRQQPVATTALLQLASGRDGIEARSAPARLPTEQLARQPANTLLGSQALADWIEALPAGALIQVQASEQIQWGQLTNSLGPVLVRGLPAVLSPLSQDPKSSPAP
jgi:hypothetical protein